MLTNAKRIYHKLIYFTFLTLIALGAEKAKEKGASVRADRIIGPRVISPVCVKPHPRTLFLTD